MSLPGVASSIVAARYRLDRGGGARETLRRSDRKKTVGDFDSSTGSWRMGRYDLSPDPDQV